MVFGFNLATRLFMLTHMLTWLVVPLIDVQPMDIVFFVGSNLICWFANKQPIVSRNSTEEKYRGSAMAVVELLYISKLFKDILASFLVFPQYYGVTSRQLWP